MSAPRNASRGRGVGRSTGHHGELLQGRFRCPVFDECPGLVTVPIGTVGSVAVFVPDTSGVVRAVGTARDVAKARRAAEVTLAHLRVRGVLGCTGGELRVTRTTAVGLGLGSSTADVLAAVRAVADCAGAELDAETVARLAVAAEGASDPLWADRPILFAHRHGHVIEELGAVLPPMLLVRCVLGGPVDTLALRPTGAGDVEEYEDLRALLRCAVAAGDAAGVAAVATRSAVLNQSRHYKPGLGRLIAAAERGGALGVQVAHSGNVAGLLFAREHPRERVRRACTAVRAAGFRIDETPIAIGGAA
ncbi:MULTISPECIES: GHMP kinase [Tsukamurella]|uniref:GHMP kinase n=2 Tax=Tsukamurella TaxID=2060 RepID=A0A5C5S7M6_9ACTN|nr:MULTISPECIES: GHMP kinase [Tsukamurella]NMD58140.1 GHMP kinase [Tsukamurella columbiensis]TWS30563.1 GHMP kinase [Tsukamurella conjunctivitidis]